MTRIGDGPVQKEYEDQMRAVALAIDRFFNGDARSGERKAGFVLMVFPIGTDDGRCNYISNCDRADIVTLMREQIRRFEGAPDVTGTA